MMAGERRNVNYGWGQAYGRLLAEHPFLLLVLATALFQVNKGLLHSHCGLKSLACGAPVSAAGTRYRFVPG